MDVVVISRAKLTTSANFAAPGSSGANVPQIVRAGNVGRGTSFVIQEVETFAAPGSSGANVPQIVRAGNVGKETSLVTKNVGTFAATGSSGANVHQIGLAGRSAAPHLWVRIDPGDPGIVMRVLVILAAPFKR